MTFRSVHVAFEGGDCAAVGEVVRITCLETGAKAGVKKVSETTWRLVERDGSALEAEVPG